MKKITIKVFQYEELNDQAKEKARNWFRQGALDYNWYESTYEDAAQIGLKIKEFDLYSRNIKGSFTKTEQQVASLIVENHGKDCETFKTAQKFLKDISKCEQNESDEEYQQLCEEFLKSLLEDYLVMLQQEYEYFISDEQVAESIIANEYEFTEDGKRFNLVKN